MFELNLHSLKPRPLPLIKEISKFPPVRRDIAIIVDNDISAYSLLSSMQAVKSTIISDISLFDIYRGNGMESNKKSLAFRVLLQDTEKTLTDEQVESTVTSLISILKNQFGAELRN